VRLRAFAGVVSSLALVFLVLGAAVARQSEPAPAQNAPPAAPVDPLDSGPLVASGPAPDLVLLYTGSVIGYVEPCG
jgi:hypothetical protein